MLCKTPIASRCRSLVVKFSAPPDPENYALSSRSVLTRIKGDGLLSDKFEGFHADWQLQALKAHSHQPLGERGWKPAFVRANRSHCAHSIGGYRKKSECLRSIHSLIQIFGKMRLAIDARQRRHSSSWHRCRSEKSEKAECENIKARNRAGQPISKRETIILSKGSRFRCPISNSIDTETTAGRFLLFPTEASIGLQRTLTTGGVVRRCSHYRKRTNFCVRQGNFLFARVTKVPTARPYSETSLSRSAWEVPVWATEVESLCRGFRFFCFARRKGLIS